MTDHVQKHRLVKLREQVTALRKVQKLSESYFQRAIGRRSSKTFDYDRRSYRHATKIKLPAVIADIRPPLGLK